MRNDTEHIWLRQTVTFTVDGQTRTLEIGVPVPRDATTQDVEILLDVADAGMRALSRRLGMRIAEELDGVNADTPALPSLPAPAQAAASANGHAPEEPVTTEPLPAAEQPAERTRNSGADRIPTPRAPERQTPSAQPQPAAASERPQQRSEPPRAKPPVIATTTSAVNDPPRVSDRCC